MERVSGAKNGVGRLFTMAKNRKPRGFQEKRILGEIHFLDVDLQLPQEQRKFPDMEIWLRTDNLVRRLDELDEHYEKLKRRTDQLKAARQRASAADPHERHEKLKRRTDQLQAARQTASVAKPLEQKQKLEVPARSSQPLTPPSSPC